MLSYAKYSKFFRLILFLFCAVVATWYYAFGLCFNILRSWLLVVCVSFFNSSLCAALCSPSSPLLVYSAKRVFCCRFLYTVRRIKDKYLILIMNAVHKENHNLLLLSCLTYMILQFHTFCFSVTCLIVSILSFSFLIHQFFFTFYFCSFYTNHIKTFFKWY